LAEKLKIVEETYEAGTSVSIVARRHDVNANQLFSWRRQYKKGELTERKGGVPALIPVGIIGAPGLGTAAGEAKRIEIELASGIKVRIDGTVQSPVLESVLKMVRSL
jgi:transposase